MIPLWVLNRKQITPKRKIAVPGGEAVRIRTPLINSRCAKHREGLPFKRSKRDLAVTTLTQKSHLASLIVRQPDVTCLPI